MQSAGAWANYVGGDVYGDHSTRANQALHWLNPLAFCPANATGPDCKVDPKVGIDYVALGNSARGIARAPGSFSNDMTLSKRVPLSERWGSLDFRLAAFNVFNHTMLGGSDTNIANRNSRSARSPARARRATCNSRSVMHSDAAAAGLTL